MTWRADDYSGTGVDEPEILRAQVAVLADWLDVAADIIHQDRGDVVIVDSSVKAADAARRIAGVDPDGVAQGAREALAERMRRR